MYYGLDMFQYYIPFDAKVSNIKEFPDNKDIWAFAYKEDERALNYICRPVKGRIKTDEYNGRYFCDTYEEAVAGFNALVNRRIKSLKDEIVKLDDMLIK